MKKEVLLFHVISYWDYPATDTSTWHYLLNELISKYILVGIESTIPLHFYEQITHASLVSTNLVELQRKTKSPYEIEKIRACAQYADKGMTAILNSVYYGACVIEPFALSRSIQNKLIQLKQFDPLTIQRPF